MSGDQHSSRKERVESRTAPASKDAEALKAEVSNPALREDQALAWLQQHDLPPEILEELDRNASLKTSRKIKVALAQHPKTPRRIALPLLRHLFTFELVKVTRNPMVLADIKKSAEDMLLNRVETLSLGEKTSLARQASGRIAGQLLLEDDPAVIRVALENSRITEASVVKAITAKKASVNLITSVCSHPKWSLRAEVRMALLRNEHTTLAHALLFVERLPSALLGEILDNSRLPEPMKLVLRKKIIRKD